MGILFDAMWVTVGCNLGHFWTSFSSIGVLWDSCGSGAELCLNFDSHVDVIFLTFSAFGGCYFLLFFQFVSETYFSRFLPNWCAFKVPTGSSGKVFCKLSGVKEKS